MFSPEFIRRYIFPLSRLYNLKCGSKTNIKQQVIYTNIRHEGITELFIFRMFVI